MCMCLRREDTNNDTFSAHDGRVRVKIHIDYVAMREDENVSYRHGLYVHEFDDVDVNKYVMDRAGRVWVHEMRMWAELEPCACVRRSHLHSRLHPACAAAAAAASMSWPHHHAPGHALF